MGPYVVSSDLGIVWSRYAGRGFSRQALDGFRDECRTVLRRSFGACDWVPEEELVAGMHQLLLRRSAPIVSLDAAYTSIGVPLDMTRLVDASGQDVGFGDRRGGQRSLADAVTQAAADLCAKEAVLVDDVIFSGALLEALVGLFARVGIRVIGACAGIAVQDGAARLESLGCEVWAVRRYEEVLDEVCERDFLPGAPLSGRTVAGFVNTGMPYLRPFGRAEQWASFPPDRAAVMSKRFLIAGQKLYRSLGDIRCRDLPRRIFGVRADAAPIADVFSSAIRRLE